MKKVIKLSSVFFIVFILTVQNSNGQDEILYRKHIIYSGINGLFYGLAIDVIAGLEGGAATGIPIISAGISALIPLLSTSAKTITPNSMILSNHGKLVGWAHGFALATLIGGENAWSDDYYKPTILLGAATSIGLGIVGLRLGQYTNWTEGQVSLYRLYGWAGPLTGLSLMASFSDNARLYGASVLLFGAGSYLLADKVYKRHEYTRGDVRAIQVLTILNGGLGYGIVADRAGQDNSSRSDFLFPAIGIIGGTLLGQLWLKDAKLTPKQGRQTGYAATGGAILGLGIALVTESEKATPYYVIPYLTGMAAYTVAVEKLKKKNLTLGFLPEKQKNNWDIAFMPQNLFLNNKISGNNYMVNGKIIGMQPLFAASLRF